MGSQRSLHSTVVRELVVVVKDSGIDVDRLPGGRGDKPYVFRIISPTQPTAREIAASSEEDMLQWIQCIRECSCNAERAVS